MPDDAPINPDELIADITKPSLSKELLLAIGIHAVLILVTSIGFIALCFRHRTLDPRGAIKTIEDARRDQELESKREAARAKILAAQKKRQPEGTKAGTAAAPDTSGQKPKVIRDLEEKSSKRPATSSMSLGLD